MLSEQTRNEVPGALRLVLNRVLTSNKDDDDDDDATMLQLTAFMQLAMRTRGEMMLWVW